MKKQSIFIGFLLAFLLPAFALAAQTSVSLGAGFITPSTVNVNAGDTVVWNNVSSGNQSVMANNASFQSGQIAPGGQFAATFNTAGTYNYYDNAGGSAILGEVIVSGISVAPQPTYVTTPAQSGASVASLTAEVQALIAEINALQGNASSNTSAAPAYTGGSCPQIGRVLSLGSSGSDVSSLQQFLGVSPATGYFGTLTQSAVESWQTSNNIISSGSPETTGFGVVGPRTAAAIRLACSGGSSAGSGSGSNTVSGFIQVSPITGNAPLTVNVTATVNVANSCNGGNYSLSFGDGTAAQTIAVPSGNCSQQNQTFQHTYQYGGTYTVTLSAGSHQSTATVTVSGTGAPGTINSSQPTGSISALVSSGPVPFNATFYVSCTSGLAYDVVFGDGTDLGSTGVSQSSCNGGLQGVAHTYTSAGSYTAQLEIFVRNSNGTVSPISVASQPIVVGSGSSTTYQPPSVTPNVGGNPLEVSLQYNYDTSACEVSIQWGDGSSINPTGCSNLTGQLQTYTQTHTYAQAGSYTITLERASQTSTVGVSISN
jgi:plastocyanin